MIHAYDAAPIASKGLTAARKYASIAPDAPHALHMPSHVFTRVGAWSDSAATNRRGADVAKKNGDLIDAFHAADYMTYAYLQMGRIEAARKVLEEFRGMPRSNPAIFVGPYAEAMMPARAALERSDWSTAAQLPPVGAQAAFVEAITTFSRALGAARKGDVAAAEREAQRLEAHHKALVDTKNSYWAGEVEVQRVAAAAWIAKAKGQSDEALRLMRAAADVEDKSEKHIVTPGRVLPARELLGDMLLELSQPAAALAEYEQSQVREPNRLRGYAGAAAAADAAGEREKARQHYAKLVELTRDADTPLPEVTRAKTYLASR
jgi:tetratricopeptide (TPR) repeat protein